MVEDCLLVEGACEKVQKYGGNLRGKLWIKLRNMVEVLMDYQLELLVVIYALLVLSLIST